MSTTSDWFSHINSWIVSLRTMTNKSHKVTFISEALLK